MLKNAVLPTAKGSADQGPGRGGELRAGAFGWEGPGGQRKDGVLLVPGVYRAQ